jgi:hypothetical protein
MGKKSQPAPQVVRYALSSGVIAVLPTESAEDLDQLIAEITEQNEPNTPAEHYLVDQMIHARWKVLRFRRLEAVALDRILDEPYIFQPVPQDHRILNTIQQSGNILDKLEKLIVAADRAYAKALRDLTQLRASAQKSEKQNKAKAADAWLRAELAKFENEPNIDPVGYPPSQPAPGSSAPDAAVSHSLSPPVGE